MPAAYSIYHSPLLLLSVVLGGCGTGWEFDRGPWGWILAGAVALAIGLAAVLSAKDDARKEFLKNNGTPIDATVRAVSESMGKFGLRLDLTLEFIPPNGASTIAECSEFAPQISLGHVAVGMKLPVRFNPEDPSNVMVDWNAHKVDQRAT